MKKTVNELKTIVQRITLGGNEEARERHTSKNKLLARERVDKLLDPKFVVFVLNRIFISFFLF
jgi:3-methylcrotonyl-CoA carboxylase beta subunit